MGVFLVDEAAQLLLLSSSHDQVGNGGLDSWSHVEVSCKAVRLSHGDRSLKTNRDVAVFIFSISATVRDFVLVFLFLAGFEAKPFLFSVPPIGFLELFPLICGPHVGCLEKNNKFSWILPTLPIVKSVLSQQLAAPHHLQLFLIDHCWPSLL